jgi:hypothetical protein
MEDSGINTLRLGQNQFSNISPLIDLLRSKGKQYRCLDISNCPITPDTLQNGLVQALTQMTGLEEFKMVECVVDPRQHEMRRLVDSLFEANTALRQIDISMNQFGKDALNHFFKSISQNDSRLRIESLALSQVHL